ncbi:mRNA surveillance protein pelota [Stygiolobus caldivivus]|uniref:Protein pelota homolog n=1 Tax=Stygiolobus caldivivus TaxID=2824673 RepID=A0A8D5U4E2_9CREN|nr:mRNA surveillance protein pelota [Stygiolobus caldivivus]BCU69206.1 mRNA surveillance protein Pelota [Stygiolobus caldivivus]
MRILEIDEKENLIRLYVEDEDDLWVLHLILEKGDKVIARTTRDVSLGKDSRRIPMTVELQVDYTEFQQYTSRLRIHGIILDAPERFGIKGAHHTVNLDIGDEIVIIKDKWSEFALEKIKRQAEKKGKLLIALVDFDEYIIATPMAQGVRVLAERSLPTPNKENEGIIEENAKTVAEEIKSFLLSLSTNVLILAGPGPFKEIVARHLQQGIKLYLDSVSSATRNGLNEILRRDIIDQVYRDYELAEEVKVMEKIMENISKDTGLVAYGKDDVQKAVDYGAVDTLLLLEDFLASDKREEFDPLLEEVERKKGRVMIVPRDSTIYYQVKSLTGIVALLRFRIN